MHLQVDPSEFHDVITQAVDEAVARIQAERPANRPDRLLLSARDAAAALSISERTLWSITAPRGDLPCVRVGQRILYGVDDLRAWIDEHKSAPADAEAEIDEVVEEPIGKEGPNESLLR